MAQNTKSDKSQLEGAEARRLDLREKLLLYAVTDCLRPRKTPLHIQVEQAIQGGATIIQFREKRLDESLLIQEALKLKEICAKYHVPLILNDHVKIAKEIDCDGVHVGQTDMQAGEARAILGRGKILGISAHNLKQAILAEKMGADYIGAGAIFPTNSKQDASSLTHETLKAICKAVKIPVIAIGGIGAHNLGQLRNTGICGVAVISAIFAQENILHATKELKDLALKFLHKEKTCTQH